MKATLVEAAWGSTRKKDGYLRAKYHRVASRRGKKRALMAVAHKILISAYHIIGNEGVAFKDLGEGYFEQKDKYRLKDYWRRKLENLGYTVKIEEKKQDNHSDIEQLVVLQKSM